MKLRNWVARELENDRGENKRDVLTRLGLTIDLLGGERVSLITLQAVAAGMKLELYRKARAIEKATGGDVTVKDLCEDD